MKLDNRVVLVTSGTRIGACIAVELARAGADVALVYRTSRKEAEQAAQTIRALRRQAVLVPGDLRNPDVPAHVVGKVVDSLGRLDVLVNMASVYRTTPFDELTEEAWDETIEVDLLAAVRCAREAVRHMRQAGAGRIINLADWVAPSGRPRYRGFLPYYVAKAALVALTEALALELAEDRILVNAIAPGPIVPPAGTSVETIESVVRATPVGRWGGEIEVAKAVLWLIESDFVTSETVRVDGGRHLR